MSYSCEFKFFQIFNFSFCVSFNPKGQNNGNPLVVYAPSSEPAAPIAPISLPAPPPPSPSPAPCAPAPPSPPPCSAAPPPPCGSAPPAPWPPVPVQPAPCNSAVGPIIAAAPSAPSAPAAPWNAAAPSAPAAAVTADDLSQAQALADQSVLENAPLEAAAAPQSDQPCHVETSTEVVQHPGETFVHQPGEILISQPPTRLVINHAPYIVRPSPVVLNQGGKTITNAYTRKILPGQVQYRPIIVRIVKPIERKVLIDKPAGPCGSQSYVSSPPVPNPCDVALAPYQSAPLPPLSAAPQAPASAAYPPSAVALSPSAYGINSAIDASSVLSPAAATAADQASLAALLSQANLSVSIIENDFVDSPNIYQHLSIKHTHLLLLSLFDFHRLRLVQLKSNLLMVPTYQLCHQHHLAAAVNCVIVYNNENFRKKRIQ